MIAGVSTASLFMREMNEDALTVLNGLGVKCTEVFLTTFSEYTEEFARLLLSRRGEVQVNSVHLLNTEFEPQLFAAHPRARADAYAYLRGAMHSAHIFGAHAYTLHGITRLKRNSVPRDYGKLAEDLADIQRACRAEGVEPCLENVHWALYNEPGIFSGIRAHLPSLKGVLDVKQARLSGYPYQMYIRDMEGAISHVHLSDVDESGKICLPGRGLFDFEECLKRLKDAGFDGAALIEVYPRDYGDYTELKRSCDYLAEIAYKLG